MQDSAQQREYIAFISYRHAARDTKIARRIMTLTEHYRIPEAYREDYPDGCFGNVFLDENELTVTASLSEAIRTALDNSRYMIVICSEETPDSRWVDMEIRYFLEHHDASAVFPVIASGTVETSLPPAFADHPGGDVPFAANLTDVRAVCFSSSLKREMLRVYAAMLHCPYDHLWEREKRYDMRRNRFFAAGTVCAAALMLSGFLYVRQRLGEQRQSILEQQEVIEETRTLLRQEEAAALLSQGEAALRSGDRRRAAEIAADVLRQQEGTTEAVRAYRLLSEARLTYRTSDTPVSMNRVTQQEEVRAMLLSKDGTRLFTADKEDVLRVYDTESAALCWEKAPADYRQSRSKMSVDEDGLMVTAMDDSLLLRNDTRFLTAYRVSDGSEAWSCKRGWPENDFLVLSPEGDRAVIITQETPTDETGAMPERVILFRLLDLSDGSVLREAWYPFDGNLQNGRTYGMRHGAFTKDGTGLCCALYLRRNDTNEENIHVFRWDFAAEEVRLYRTKEEGEGGGDVIYGLCDAKDGSGDILLTYYQRKNRHIVTGRFSETGDFRAKGIMQILGEADSRGNDTKVRYLAGEEFIFVAAENIVHVFDRNGDYMNHFVRDAAVVSVDLLNTEADGSGEDFAVTCADGSNAMYYAAYAEDGTFFVNGSASLVWGDEAASQGIKKIVYPDGFPYLTQDLEQGFQGDDRIRIGVVTEGNPCDVRLMALPKNPRLETLSAEIPYAYMTGILLSPDESMLLATAATQREDFAYELDPADRRILYRGKIGIPVSAQTAVYGSSHFVLASGLRLDLNGSMVTNIPGLPGCSAVSEVFCALANGSVAEASVQCTVNVMTEPSSCVLLRVDDGDCFCLTQGDERFGVIQNEEEPVSSGFSGVITFESSEPMQFPTDGERTFGTTEASFLRVGAQGLMAVGIFDREEPGRPLSFLIADVLTKEVTGEIPVRENADAPLTGCVSDREALLAVAAVDGTVDLYDLKEMKHLQTIATKERLTPGAELRFCEEDALLMLRTESGRLFFLYTEEGRVSEAQDTAFLGVMQLSTQYDPARHMLFLSANEAMVAYDTLTGTELFRTDAPGVYTPQGDLILITPWDSYLDLRRLSVLPVQDAEALLSGMPD